MESGCDVNLISLFRSRNEVKANYSPPQYCVSVRSEEIQRRGLGRQNASDPTRNADVAQLARAADL